MTSPLTPIDCDLSKFPFMPILIQRLKQSRSWLLCKRNPALAFYLINLWTAAWHSKPAGSLEDDDLVLADLAMCTEKVWTKVRGDVMRGWVRCDDGRLYHPVVAEQARAAWASKCAQLARTDAARRAREENRRSAVTASVTTSVTDNVTETVTESNRQGHRQGYIEASSLRSEDASENASPEEPSDEPKPKRPRKHPYPHDAFDRWYAGYPNKVGRGAAEKAFGKIRSADQVSFEALVDGVARYCKSKPTDREWCNPATWLNQGRWTDEPATLLTSPPAGLTFDEPRIDLGGGITAKPSAIRDIWRKGRWPNDWGPRPDQPGCRIPPETMTTIMSERVAA